MANLKLPDGTVINGVPDGLTLDQFMSGLKQANPGAFDALVKRSALNGPGLEPTRLERVGRGMKDPVAGVRQIIPEEIGGYSSEENAAAIDEVKLYEKGAGPGTDWYRMGGQAAMLSPFGAPAALSKAGLVGRGLLGGALGGGSSGLLFAKTPEERRDNIAAGAVGGAVFSALGPPVARLTGKTAGAIREGVNRLTSPKQILQTVTVELQDAAQAAGYSLSDLGQAAVTKLKRDAAKSLNRTGKTNAEALVRLARAEQAGFKGASAMTPGQATRDPRMYSTEQNLSKLQDIGDPLMDRFDAQRAQVGKSLEGMKSRFNAADDITAFSAGETVERSAKTVAERMQQKVRNAYTAAEKARPDVELSKTGFQQRIMETLTDFEDKIPAGVKSRINALIADDGRRFTPTEAAKLDKLITDTLPSDPFAKADRMAARQLQEAIADTMEEAGDRAGEFGKLYKNAKKVAAERFAAIGSPRQLTARLVAGSLDPEKVVPQVMRGSTRAIQNLKKFVEPSNPEAWGQIQGSVLNDVLEKALPSGEFSQAGYNKAIRQMGPERLKLLFGDDGAKELIEFGKVARDLFALPGGHRVNTSNSAPTAFGLVKDAFSGLIGHLPGGQFVTGLKAASDNALAQKAKVTMVNQILNPSPPPIANLLEGFEPYLRGAAPSAGGLLNIERTRDR